MIPDWWLPNLHALWSDLTAGQFDLWLIVRWMGQNLTLTGLIFLADLILGTWLLRGLRIRLAPRLQAASAIGLGAGASCLLLMGLALLGLLNRPAVFVLTGASLALGIPLLRRRRDRRLVFGWLAVLRSPWLAAIVPAGLLLVSGQLMPVMEYDATMYHAASARWYGESGSLAYHPGIRFNAQPHLPVLGYVRQLHLLGDDLGLKLFNLELVFALGMALAHFSRRRRLSGAWPLLFCASSPLFVWMTQVEFADLAMCVWFALAAVVALEPAQRPWLTGILLGFSAASKLQGLVMAAFFLLALLVKWRRLQPAIAAGLAVAAVGLPWWVRSFAATGSPAAPFFLAHNADAAQLFNVSSRYGVGKGIREFFSLPWDAVAQSPYIFADPFAFGPPLLLVVLAIPAAAILRRRPSRSLQFLLVAFVPFLFFWFRSAQVMRYLAAEMPLLAMLFTSAAAALRLRRQLLVPLGLAAAIGLAAPCAVIRFRALPPVTFAEKERLLAETLRYYPAVRHLNSIAGANDRVYLWFCEEARYHVRPRSFGDWFGSLRYGEIGEPGAAAAQLTRRLRGLGFRYILGSRSRMARGGSIYSQEFLASGFVRPQGTLPPGVKQVFSDGDYVLWQIE
jgi:hypothetical protein